MAASHYALLHLPNPLHSRHLFFSSPTPRCRLFLAPSSAARPRRASAGPLVFETEEERPGSGWSSATADTPQSDYDDEEEQGWAGGNSAGRGESHEEDGGGWRPRRSRPRELFVCNLPRRCDVDDLYELFRPYGTVLSVEISRDPETGLSRGCGFVTMRSLPEARTAMNALDGFDLDGRELLVKLSSDVVSKRRNINMSHTPPVKDHIFESPHKIYIGNIAWSVQPQELREYFSQCGTVVSTRLLTDRKGGRGRVYGFLSFASAEEVEAALKLDNTHFHGRNILVREAHEDRQAP
ncbi:RNA-binding protein CP29B, chloroplastic [Oryza brachyantha]|uniref:RNA-binding protein CP29B, chloroplastic n=1 Tax=Oryza brachyantha TaxID=4533 RepID=UPI001ADCD0E1|nr:RNA-binding protein CP29B, chloroplastic [Oryza brachyantha]